MLDLKVGRDAHGHTVIRGTPSHTVVPAELNVSLSWATPHTTWPQHMGSNPTNPGKKSHDPRGGTTTHTSEENRGIRKFSSHSHTTSRSSFSSAAGVTDNHAAGSTKEDSGSNGVQPNLAIAFESLYGRMYLSNVICSRAEKLLAVGAYAHRLP